MKSLEMYNFIEVFLELLMRNSTQIDVNSYNKIKKKMK